MVSAALVGVNRLLGAMNSSLGHSYINVTVVHNMLSCRFVAGAGVERGGLFAGMEHEGFGSAVDGLSFGRSENPRANAFAAVFNVGSHAPDQIDVRIIDERV